MSMLAEVVDIVIGVDTHKHTNTAAVVSAGTAAAIETATTRTDPEGYAALLALADQHNIGIGEGDEQGRLAAKRQRIPAGSVRQLIHETLHVDGVLVDVDTPPEAGRHRRVAHGMLHQQVGHRVADGMIAIGQQALEGEGVHAVFHPAGVDRRQDGLSGDTDMQACQLALFIEPAHQFALGNGMVVTMPHILFAGPQQLYRCAR